MKKEVSFEGHIYQDINSSRKPIYLLREEVRNTETLEKLLANEEIVPTVSTRNNLYSKASDFTAPPMSGFGTIPKDYIRENLKKVKITVTIEEI